MEEDPSWLNREMLREALQRTSGLNIDVDSIKIKPLVAKGDNYSSTMHLITAQTSKGQLSLVAKTMPSSEQMAQNMRIGRTFEREAVMVSDVIPYMQGTLQELAERARPIIKSQFAPSCPLHAMAPEELIYLDDLCFEGFRLANRQQGLDYAHSLLALRTLAAFHASSIKYLQKNPKIVETLGNPFELLMDRYLKKSVDDTFPKVSVMCKKWDGFKEIGEYIESITSTAASEVASCNSHEGNKFNVICHGDFWINNMMFKYDEDTVTDIRFVDFQMSHVGSPMTDVIYFLSSSVGKEVFESHWENLLREYHDVLQSTISMLFPKSPDVRAPNLQVLKEEIETNGVMGIFGAAVILPVTKAQKEFPEIEAAFSMQQYDNSFLYTSDVEEWLKLSLKALCEWSVFKRKEK